LFPRKPTHGGLSNNKKYQKITPISLLKNCFDLLNFICNFLKTFNILFTVCPNITKSPWCTLYSLRDFQQHQGHGVGCHGLGDFNITNKINKLTS
jgi:hypothetical protein